jgi:hypothetical protein
MPAKAGMLLKSEMTAAVGTKASSWMSSAFSSQTAKIDNRQRRQQHLAGTSATVAGTPN